MEEVSLKFVELNDSEMYDLYAGRWGWAIIGCVGGALTGAVTGAGAMPGCPAAGAVLGGIGGACTGAVIGWKKK